MEQLREIFKDFGLSLTEEQIRLLTEYEKLLLEWNEKINLTAITDHREICIKHFLDSAVLLLSDESLQQKAVVTNQQKMPTEPFKNKYIPDGAKVADVGTGAGFPGMVLKILRPDISLTLIDSLQKRLRFLAFASEVLGLKNTLLHGRGEEVAQQTDYRESFDVVTARAVTNLQMLGEICLPLVRKGGVFIAMKGAKWKAEMALANKAIDICGGKLKTHVDLLLPEMYGRGLLFIQKIKTTPKAYPRTTAKMKKMPLE